MARDDSIIRDAEGDLRTALGGSDYTDHVMQQLKETLEKEDPPEWHPSPDESLLTNVDAGKDRRIYQKAGKVLGFQVRFDTAYDIDGNVLPNSIGVYVKPSRRKREIWDWMKEQETAPPLSRYQLLLENCDSSHCQT